MIVLASESSARAALLANAGVPFETARAGVDEEALKTGLRAEGADPRAIADALAQAKAVKVSRRREGLVIGADSTVELDGELYDKPGRPEVAEAQLLRFRGQTHRLHSAVVVAESGAPVWRAVQSVRLTMRAFSDGWLEAYLAAEGDAILACVGGYRLEGRGVDLFERIEGDYFAVLGLPLIPLLGYLRLRGEIPS